jgi:hypothetical protein
MDLRFGPPPPNGNVVFLRQAKLNDAAEHWQRLAEDIPGVGLVSVISKADTDSFLQRCKPVVKPLRLKWHEQNDREVAARNDSKEKAVQDEIARKKELRARLESEEKALEQKGYAAILEQLEQSKARKQSQLASLAAQALEAERKKQPEAEKAPKAAAEPEPKKSERPAPSFVVSECGVPRNPAAVRAMLRAQGLDGVAFVQQDTRAGYDGSFIAWAHSADEAEKLLTAVKALKNPPFVFRKFGKYAGQQPRDRRPEEQKRKQQDAGGGGGGGGDVKLLQEEIAKLTRVVSALAHAPEKAAVSPQQPQQPQQPPQQQAGSNRRWERRREQRQDADQQVPFRRVPGVCDTHARTGGCDKLGCKFAHPKK